eukprot:7399153-Pyramimonas_sp.AAC.1
MDDVASHCIAWLHEPMCFLRGTFPGKTRRAPLRSLARGAAHRHDWLVASLDVEHAENLLKLQ